MTPSPATASATAPDRSGRPPGSTQVRAHPLLVRTPRRGAGLALAGAALVLLAAVATLAALPVQARATAPAGTGSLAPRTCADLVISSISVTPEQPAAGEAVEIRVTARNQGDAAANGVRVSLYVDPAVEPPTAGTPPTAELTYGLLLPPGAAVNLTRRQVFASAGDHVIYALVAPLDGAAECDAANNLAGPASLRVYETPDAYEPDNTCAVARVAAVDGEPQQRSLSPQTDVDWVAFPVTSGATYHVQAEPVGSDADLALALYSDCNRLTLNAGSEFTFTAWVSGFVYVNISPARSGLGPKTAYRLRITADEACSGDFEPNNTCTLAGDIAPGMPQTHSFCRQNDQDWTRLEVDAGASYRVTATGANAASRPLLSLYLGCGQHGSLSDDSTIEFTAPARGAVYLQAESLDPEAYGKATAYTLAVERLADGCERDAFEPDDDSGSAHALAPDQALTTHTFCPAGDQDWTSFPASAGVHYTIETLNLGADSDTVLCLYAPDATTPIRCDDDSGAGKGSRITWLAGASEVYRLRVTHASPTAAGEGTRYDLRLATTPCQGDVYEPNNSQETAAALTAGAPTATQNVCPAGDEDWTVFSAEAGPYVLETTGLGPEADTVLEVYDQAGRLLALNDDFDGSGASRVALSFPSAGSYYARVRPHRTEAVGAGTEYVLQLLAGTPSTTPTPSPTPAPTATPSPGEPSSPVRTMVLVNRAQVARLYGEAQAGQLMAKLDELAANDLVQGEVLNLDASPAVRDAYAAWNQRPTLVESANQAAAAIRALAMTYLGQHPGVEFMVLVGDDRLLPFRRLPDHSPQQPSERSYASQVDPDHPTGAAIEADTFLSDDYYADRKPALVLDHELYVPEIAAGRLVETPAGIIAFIDRFLAAPVTPAGRILVTGYDFLEDSAGDVCRTWQEGVGEQQTDCQLIGSDWTVEDLRDRQVRADPPFKVQSINGHASHRAEGTPAEGIAVSAVEVGAATTDLSGGLIYTPGCQSGLNLPPTNTRSSPYDLPEAFAGKLANYVGNTGYGWGFRNGVAFSERLMELYTEELRSDREVSVGQALVRAKARYVRESASLGSVDEKVLQELTLYGLPMYRLHTGAAPALAGDPFPSVHADVALPGGLALAAGEVVTGAVSINLAKALGEAYEERVTATGSYFALDGHAGGSVDQPLQPVYFTPVDTPHAQARGVLFLGGSYATRPAFDPVMFTPTNEYAPAVPEAAPDPAGGWQPAVPVALQAASSGADLVARMGQFAPQTGQQRLYDALKAEVLYGDSPDRLPPEIHLVDAASGPDTPDPGAPDAVATDPVAITFKVGAGDASGISRVVITYDPADGEDHGRWQSFDLLEDQAAGVWKGVMMLPPTLRYLVQVVDGAGNVTTAANKGHYYRPAPSTGGNSGLKIFLPTVLRERP